MVGPNEGRWAVRGSAPEAAPLVQSPSIMSTCQRRWLRYVKRMRSRTGDEPTCSPAFHALQGSSVANTLRGVGGRRIVKGSTFPFWPIGPYGRILSARTTLDWHSESDLQSKGRGISQPNRRHLDGPLPRHKMLHNQLENRSFILF